MGMEQEQRTPEYEITSKEINNKEAEKTDEKEKGEFVIRSSTLTNLFQVYHFRFVFAVSLAVFVLMYLNAAICYYFNSQKFKKDMSILRWTFGKLHIVTATWLGMMFSTVFMFYPAFRFWCNTRFFIWKRSSYDSIFCFLLIIYQMVFLFIPAKIVLNYNLPPSSSLIVIAEQLRLIMKTHAFVRENAARILTFQPHPDNDKKNFRCPEVQKFIYFLFAPTFLYRDNYPRTPYIRWWYVAWNFLQFLGCIMAAFIPVTNFAIDKFNNAGAEPISFADFINLLAMSVFAGGVVKLTIFYGLLHCWLNVFAEMLRFGDRKFYDDWWNCTSFAKFYRSWNLVVYKWLHVYVYQDIYNILGKNQIATMYMVFFISAVGHEYLLAMVFKHVFPLLFSLYMSAGTMYVFLTRRATSIFWNAFLWGSLLQGWGFLVVFYSLEWYARINCPRTIDSWVDYFIPRSFTCNIVSLQG